MHVKQGLREVMVHILLFGVCFHLSLTSQKIAKQTNK